MQLSIPKLRIGGSKTKSLLPLASRRLFRVKQPLMRHNQPFCYSTTTIDAGMISRITAVDAARSQPYTSRTAAVDTPMLKESMSYEKRLLTCKGPNRNCLHYEVRGYFNYLRTELCITYFDACCFVFPLNQSIILV